MTRLQEKREIAKNNIMTQKRIEDTLKEQAKFAIRSHLNMNLNTTESQQNGNQNQSVMDKFNILIGEALQVLQSR